MNKILLRKYTILFLLAFLLNLIWEIFHAPLYVGFNFPGDNLPVLVRASIGDGFMIVIATFLVGWFFKKSNLNFNTKELCALFLLEIVYSATWEKVSLILGRWSYKPIMPLIPYLNISVLVFFQIAITGVLALKITETVLLLKKKVHPKLV